MNKILAATVAAACIAVTFTGCSHLSPEAKKITGRYFIPEISEEQPLLDLRKDGHCVVTKIVPGVLTYSVEGRWNVRNDSLVARLNPDKVTVDGDSTLVGDIPDAVAFKITKSTDVSLSIERGGVEYTYYRRPEQ